MQEAVSDYSTALYYVFSTIPQTLAGLLGVLGAFLVFRLSQERQSLSQSMYQIYRDQRDPGWSTPELDDAFHKEDAQRFLRLVEQIKLVTVHRTNWRS
jgi:hypothetical protein